MKNSFTDALIGALEPAAEAVTIAGADGVIIDGNPAIERVYRRPLADVIGEHPLIFCPDTPRWKDLSKRIWAAIDRFGRWDGVVMNKDLDNGSEFPILLRTRKVEHEGIAYVISWARPFPQGAPFDLSEQEAACFRLLGQGMTIKEVAGALRKQDGSKGVSVSTVTTMLRDRIWIKAKQTPESYTTPGIEHLAVRCAEAGWDPTMKLNDEIS